MATTVSIIDGLLDQDEAAKYLKISRRVLLNLYKSGKLTYSKINYRQKRFKISDLESFLERTTHHATKGVYAWVQEATGLKRGQKKKEERLPSYQLGSLLKLDKIQYESETTLSVNAPSSAVCVIATEPAQLFSGSLIVEGCLFFRGSLPSNGCLLALGSLNFILVGRTGSGRGMMLARDIADQSRGCQIQREMERYRNSVPGGTERECDRVARYARYWPGFRRDIEFLGMHCKWMKNKDEGGWRYEPKGIPSEPLIIGDLAAADIVLIGESTWDPIAYLDEYRLYKEDGWAIVITRGARNAKLFPAELVKPEAVILALAQNDAANAQWLKELTQRVPGREVTVIRPPDECKDYNDYVTALYRERNKSWMLPLLPL
jgi:excisionase family DNA binding protein